MVVALMMPATFNFHPTKRKISYFFQQTALQTRLHLPQALHNPIQVLGWKNLINLRDDN